MFEALIEDLAALSPLDLDAVIAEAELAKRCAEARIAAAAAIVSARAGFRDHGHRSMRSYLKGTLNCSGSVANKIRKRAEVMNHHATIGDALFTGRIGTDQADLLGNAHTHPVAGKRFAEFAPQLLDHAEHLEFNDFEKVVAHFTNLADPDGAFDDQRFREGERSAALSVVDGAVEVFASGGSPLAAAEMKSVFDAAVEAEFDRDCAVRRAAHGDGALAAPLPRTAQQRKFDALHAIFIASVRAPADGKAPEPMTNVLIDHVTAGRVLEAHGLVASADLFGIGPDAFAAIEADLLQRTCSIDGTPVHPDVALSAMITGRIRRAVIDADGVTIDLGRSQRLFTGKAREAAQLLAVTCTHRGCDIPAKFCDVDHRREWIADDGSTDQHNAMPLCGVHDRWKHTNKIRSRRATSGRIYLIRPDGSVVKPVGETDPPWAEPPPCRTSPPERESVSPDVDVINAGEKNSDVADHDPWADFGRPMSEAELAACRIEPDAGWLIRILDADSIRRR